MYDKSSSVLKVIDALTDPDHPLHHQQQKHKTKTEKVRA